MEWSTLFILSILLILIGAVAYSVHRFTVRTRKTFCARQPNLRITNVSAMTTGNILTFSPELENVGGGVAYDCIMQLGGWDGSFAVKHVYPRGPRSQKHAVSIVLGPDAPIRAKPLSNGYLRLCYRDSWGLGYECWYPVIQQSNGFSPPYDIEVDLEHPDLTEPHPSLWKMWTMLRTKPTYD